MLPLISFCFNVRLKGQIDEQEEVCDQLSASMCDMSSGLQSSECLYTCSVGTILKYFACMYIYVTLYIHMCSIIYVRMYVSMYVCIYSTYTVFIHTETYVYTVEPLLKDIPDTIPPYKGH